MVFNAMLLILIVPFQVLMIPLYVMIVRGYLLGDTYLGMILPFAVNATAVFIFHSSSSSCPGAVRVGPPRRRQRVQDPHPHRHPAGQAGHPDRGDPHLHRPLERVPVAVPGHQAACPAAPWPGQLHLNLAARQANPFGAILAGRWS